MVDKGGGEGRRAGEGGDKTEGEAGTAVASKGRYHNVVLAFAQSRIKEAPSQANLLYMMKVNPSCNSQFAISDQRSYFLRILAPV